MTNEELNIWERSKGVIEVLTCKEFGAWLHRRDMNIQEQSIKSNGVKTELEPCEDFISRKMAIEAIEEIQPIDTEYDCTLYDEVDVMYILHSLPSVIPQQKWIPISKELPKDHIHVLCQFALGGMGECYLAHGLFHIVGGVRMSCDEVIAWMPLPQSYKAEREG